MDKKKSLERQYALNVPRLKTGENTDEFEVGPEFFELFPHTLIQDAAVKAFLKVKKNESHLDVLFQLSGAIKVACDRCAELYPHSIEATHRVFYAFDEAFNAEEVEVVYVRRDEPHLTIVQELYDFINIEVPLRRVPEADVHVCAPEVLKMLGLDEKGNPLPEDNPGEEEREIDPRWESLKRLRDQMDSL